MNIIIQILLVSVAAMAKAVYDTINYHDGGKLRRYKFFRSEYEGKYLPFTKYPFDGQHLSASVMMGSFLLAASCGSWGSGFWMYVIQFAILSTVLILVFNLFWNKILN